MQSSPLCAQEEKLFSPKKMIKDFEDFVEMIEAHPDPYLYLPEEYFAAKIKEVKATLDKPMSALDFYKKVASIAALIGDGHSSVRLPEFWMLKQRKEIGAFPLEFHLSNENELFLTKDYGNTNIPTSSKILALNGISVDSFLRKVDPYISYELKHFRNTLIDDNFEKYLYLAFGHSHNTKIKYLASETSETVVENMPFNDWKILQKDDREEREKKIARGEPYDYEKIADGVGLISIYSFAPRNLTNYDIFLNKTFKKIKKDSIHSLVIDIRGNYGGWPKVASNLFHYLSNTYFKTMAQSEMKVSAAYRQNIFRRYPGLKFNSPTIRQRRHFVDIGAIIHEPIGTVVKEDIFFNEEPIDENFEFKGDCFLLTNRDSYSAASSFASTFQCYQMGTIIGSETGGTKIFRANAIYEKLGQSGLIVSMSTTKLYTTCFDGEAQGISPTIKYVPSIFEIVSDLDTQLIFAQRIIKKIQKKKAANAGQ